MPGSTTGPQMKRRSQRPRNGRHSSTRGRNLGRLSP
jgi:hypothetical protein